MNARKSPLYEDDICLCNHQMLLKRSFRKNCEEYDLLQHTDFQLLSLLRNAEIRYNFCVQLKNVDNKSIYCYIKGTSLYWVQLSRLFVEKEHSTAKEDFFTDVAQTHDISRYEMGKSKEQKHKDAHAERTTASGKPSKDVAMPVGRQTNNSLASATGQILIQSVSNPNKKKMKTSQVFSQCEEDLQTGLHKILDHIKDHDDAWPFVDPVEEEYAPNYYSIIRKPMDLQKMEERLENSHYKTFSKFKTDFQLIVNNCRLYNGVDNEYTEMVGNLQEAFDRAVERYLDQVTSSDDEIAVEFQEAIKQRKKHQTDDIQKVVKKVHKLDEDTLERKKKKQENNDDAEMRSVKKKREKFKEKAREEKNRIKSDKMDQGKENKKVNKGNDDEGTPKKAKKRKSEVLDEYRSKKDEKDAKHRKIEAKKSRKDDKERERRREHHKKAKEMESKRSNSHSISKKHRKEKTELLRKVGKKVNKKSASRSPSRIQSRSCSLSSHERSRSRDRWSSTPPPSSPESILSTPMKSKKSFFTKESLTDSMPKHKSKYDQWKEVFQPDLADKHERDDAIIKPKDKHNTLRETIEKLKAKSNLGKMHVEKDIRIYDFPSDPKESKREKERDSKVKRKTSKDDAKFVATCVKKKKPIKEQSANERMERNPSVDGKNKAKKVANNSKKFDALSLATEQTLKDINKWLDDTPKFHEFSSTSNSPSHSTNVDDTENKSAEPDKKTMCDKAKKDASSPNVNSSLANANKKRPPNRDPSKLFRRKEVQRTIDRLQPGKSKGNLLTNTPNKDNKQEDVYTLGPLSKIKDTKNSLIVKTDDSAPKLSLGSVLDSFGKHKFIDDDKSSENDSDLKAKNNGDNANIKDDKKKETMKREEVKMDSPKLDNSPGAATPNLSAWFKAFGAPKVPPTMKKADLKEEKPAEVEVAKKEETRKASPPDPSPNPDSPLTHGQPGTRQRKISTGSSVSERSSFSQDMDSPRGGVDERLCAYPAPYPSPMHKSPSGASPNLSSPLPEASPKSYTFNGQIRVGFYQDTVSTKSSPDKSCSPRDNPQSPYAQYSEQHVYTPPTTHNSNYSYNNAYYQGCANYSTSNPTPPYNTESNVSYYDTTKPLTDQYQTKNPNSPTTGGQQSQQHSPHMSQPNSPNIQPLASPIDVPQHFQQPHSPVVANPPQDVYGSQQATSQQQSPSQNIYQHQVVQQPPQMEANYRTPSLDYTRQEGPPPNVEPFRVSDTQKTQQPSNSYPVKKRVYNETYSDETAQPYVNREPSKYIHQNIPEPRSQLQHIQLAQPSNSPANQYSAPNYNYPSEAPSGGHQYSPINIPSAGRTGMGVIEDTRKLDMAKFTNMGYQHYKQGAAPNPGDPMPQARFVDDNGYKAMSQNPVLPTNEVSIPRAPYSATGQLDMDQSLSLRGLTHIVDRYPNEDSRMLGIHSNNPLPQSYYDKNTGQHMFAGKPSPALPMFPQSNTMSPYGVQTHPNMYNQPPQQQQTQQPSPQQQQHAAPVAPEPKPKKKRLSKAAKAAAAAAAAQAQAQQTAGASNPAQPSVEASGQSAQGFQSYSGLKNPTSVPSMEPSAISLKTTSVVPGSAFNFGPSTTGLPLPPSLYGDKDAYSNFLEDFRSAPNYYMAAAAAAHHRATPDAAEKSAPAPRVSAHQSNTPSAAGVPSSASYPFIGAPQGRPPSYPPLAGVAGHFMPPPPHQAPLMDTSSPQYLQYLQAGVLHQGLLPPGAYAPGYHPALSIRQPYDSMTRPPWL